MGESICQLRHVWLSFLYHFYFSLRRNSHLFNANSADHDQTPFAASDLGLHCLPMSYLWIARQSKKSIYHAQTFAFFHDKANLNIMF